MIPMLHSAFKYLFFRLPFIIVNEIHAQNFSCGAIATSDPLISMLNQGTNPGPYFVKLYIYQVCQNDGSNGVSDYEVEELKQLL